MADRIEISQPSKEEVDNQGVFNWPIWTCEVSEFPWTYSDRETCYILEGKIEVSAGEEKVNIKPGDLVVFPKGLSCRWDVTVPVRKHYKFG